MTSLHSARRLLPLAAVLWFLLASAAGFAEAQTLVPAGSVWKYLDTGAAAGTGWTSLAYDDSAWRAGPAQLGYGDGDESTVVRYGSSSQKYITTYFRHTFTVSDAAGIGGLDLRLVRDDGAVVYLNGTEIWRTNMPGGSVTSSTLATSVVDLDDESAWLTTPVPASLLLSGSNVIAIEIHQANATSSDISFDLALSAAGAPGAASLVRGPYVQMGTPTSMVLRWRTDRQTPSVVDYGLSPDSLPWSAADPALKTEHAVALTGLQADTTYYYAVGTGSERLAGGDQTHAFATSPPAGTAKPTRIWVLGDSGTADANAAAVRNGYQSWTGQVRTDFWVMLGDNAYENGTDAEYTAAVFNTYPAMLRSSVLWPTLGNHDAVSSSSASQTGPYFEAFTLPRNGEAGGAASGTEAYYSFDYGNIHVIVLDSSDSSRSSSGQMAEWLRSDLAQNTLPWTIATFHHAPHAQGSRNADWDTEMTQMRENLMPILEQWGVDLVLAGHSHDYERSVLIDGYYEQSDLFSEAYVKDGGNGREDGTGVYRKSAGVPHGGTVYAVVGCSGDPSSSGSHDHPAMLVNLVTLGSLVIDVNGLRLDATFIDHQGVRRDYFTIWKDTAPPPPPPPTPPAPPTNLTASAQSTATVSLSWLDHASDETAFEVERKTGTAAFAVIAVAGANVSSFTDTGLAAATAYSYRVRALRDGTPSAWSNVVTVKTKARPAAPAALTAAAQSRSTVALAWTDKSDDETGFQIQRSTNGSTFTNVAKVGPNVTSYSVGSLKANTKYYFRVRAYRDGRNSTFSNTATATTLR